MKTQESLLKEEYNFDLLQKSNKKDNIDNYKYQFNYKDKNNNPQALNDQKKASSKLNWIL